MHLLDGDLDVRLAQAGKDELACVRITAHRQRWILFRDPVQGRADLVRVTLGLRRHSGAEGRRAGNLVGSRVTGCSRVQSVSPVVALCQLRDHADITCKKLSDRLLGLSPLVKDLPTRSAWDLLAFHNGESDLSVP